MIKMIITDEIINDYYTVLLEGSSSPISLPRELIEPIIESVDRFKKLEKELWGIFEEMPNVYVQDKKIGKGWIHKVTGKNPFEKEE